MDNKNLIRSVNRVYKNQKILYADLENFAKQFDIFRSKIDTQQREEHLKYILRDFLKKTFYENKTVNTKGDFDFAIHLNQNEQSKVGVIIETKTPQSTEMITENDLQAKSMYQSLLYYLQERIINKNNDLKNIIITNFYQWFIFDANDFEKLFFENKDLQNDFINWNKGIKTSKKTDLFYKEIAPKYIKQAVDNFLPYVFFNINDIENNIENAEQQRGMLTMYKIFSQEYLLKKSFPNTGNTLDTKFYYELLHIVGMEEQMLAGKKIITRKKIKQNASLIENTIKLLKTENRLKYVEDPEQYGNTEDEQIENIALELCIMWINRIIFLKLLESQLITYHNKNNDYSFLNIKTIKDYGELHELFFEVLAKKKNDRENYVKTKFDKIPYLNSSLFEISKLEDKVIRINSLKNHLKLPVFSGGVLKNKTELHTLQYFFEFLDAFDFTTTKPEEVQKEQKNLINSAVLGLIFEKLNGYKEGSFFTPGNITMYMSREIIRRTVVDKFREAGYKNVHDFESIEDLISNRTEANEIINSIKICDPAVGSGHFLVSALNELIAIKSELGILQYRNGNRIKNYKTEIINDELIITDKDTEEIFEYTLNQKNNPIDYKQNLQEALFHEKETIIENCLFGVDINANSVNICRLRLWIELLKNAYYKPVGDNEKSLQLHTLPNIDINIKTGNSLISQFTLNGNGRTIKRKGVALKKMRIATKKYKEQVIIYKSTNDKITKQKAENKIEELKKQFSNFSNPNDKDYKILKKKKSVLLEVQSQNPALMTDDDRKNWIHNLNTLPKKVEELEQEYKKKLKNIYGKAFEWRFEFPEVLDDDGNFKGFDVIIGNPPYIGVRTAQIDKKQSNYYKENHKLAVGQYDLFGLFIELSFNILKKKGYHSFIISKRFVANQNFKELRNFCIKDFNIYKFADSAMPFNNTKVESCIIFNEKGSYSEKITINSILHYKITELGEINKDLVSTMPFNILPVYISTDSVKLINKITLKNKIVKLGEVVDIIRGFEFGYNHKSISKKKTKYKIIRGSNIVKYAVEFDNFYVKANFNDSKKFKKEKYFLSTPKLLTRFVSNKLIFAYDNTGYCNTNVVYNIHLKNNEYDLKYLLALVNSKLLDFYFFNIYSNNDKVFPHIQKNQLETIPIIELEKKEQKPFIKLVNKILKLKKETPKADTLQLENEIDMLVYKLYNLTKEEIKIIENETT